MSRFRFVMVFLLLLAAGCGERNLHFRSVSQTSFDQALKLTASQTNPATGRWEAGPKAFEEPNVQVRQTYGEGIRYIQGVPSDRIEPTSEGYQIVSTVGTLELRRDPDENDRSGVYELRAAPGLPERFPRVTGELANDDLLRLVLLDVDETYLDTLTAEERTATWHEVMRLRSAGVTTGFVQDMRRARSTPVPSMEKPAAPGGAAPAPGPAEAPEPFTVDQIVYLSQRGINADYVEAMQAAGYRFDHQELYYLRSRGINADFARAWREIGYDLPAQSLYYLQSRGIKPEFARQFIEAGYRPDEKELYYLLSRGINAEFARTWREMGYDLSYEDLYYLRSRGINPDYARRLREAGYDLSPNQLYYLSSRGIPVDYAVALAQPGLEPLTPEQLYQLHSRGVDPEMVKRLRTPVAP